MLCLSYKFISGSIVLFLCHAEQLRQLIFLQLGADHTDPSCVFRCARSYFMLSRHHVEIDPLAVSACHHALGTENISIIVSALKLLQDFSDLLLRISMDRLASPARKHFVRVVMSLMVMMMVIVAAAAVVIMMMLMAVITVMVVMMIVVMLVVVMMIVVMLVIVVMIMVVTAALAVFVMFPALRADHFCQKFLLQ